MKKMLFILMIISLLSGCASKTPRVSVKAYDEEEQGPPPRTIPPMFAPEGLATVDGILDADEWVSAYKYPFVYNQLNPDDLRTSSDLNDLSGDFGLMHNGDMLYGYVTRTDDITYTDSLNPWENDCIELYIDVDGAFTQHRAKVGKNFDRNYGFPAKAVWNEDGSAVEFSVELPEGSAGKIIGWNIGLSDNDGSGSKYLLCPLNGQNDSYYDYNLGSLALGEDAAGDANVTLPFKAGTSSGIKVDGSWNCSEWENAVKYQFGFNQLNVADERYSKDYSDLYGDWGVVYDGNMLYGYVKRTDDITITDAPNVWENDTVELFLEINETFSQLRTVVGQGWGDGTFAADAVWSADGTVLEFSCDLGTDAAGLGIIGFNIALADNDNGETRESQLYPVYGYNDSWQGVNLAELEFVK